MSRRARILLRLLILPCTLLIFGASAAHAQDDDDDWEDAGAYTTPGTYFSMGLTMPYENFSGKIGDSDNDKLKNVRSVDSPGYGGGLRLGARATSWVSYELQFEALAGMDFKSDPLDKSREPQIFTTTFNVKIFALHGVLDSVLKGRLQPYMLGGFGMMAATDTGIQTPLSIVGRAGGGVDFHLNDSWAMFGEGSYVIPGGNLDGMKYSAFSVGFLYRLD